MLIQGNTDAEPKVPLFPHLGQRIVKTTIAVYLCLLVCSLRGLIGQGMSSEAAITAIICMQPLVHDTKTYALDRITGTLIGSIWGLLFLVFMMLFPGVESNPFVLYGLMAGGVLISLYNAVLVRKPDTSSLAAIVFICIVVSYPHIDEPLVQAVNRIIDVLIGNTIAICVNVFHLPRELNLKTLFFIKTKDLVPDKFSQVAPSVMFRLNNLFAKGAKICLVSEHAPAFFESQMSLMKIDVLMIVMDGAAVYDIKRNRYIYRQNVPHEVVVELRSHLSSLGTGYFIYTIHNDRACIFHQGRTTKQEDQLFDVLQKSPYRHYLEGEVYDSNEIVYLKVINSEETLKALLNLLHTSIPDFEKIVRPVIRKSTQMEDTYSLYLYSAQATVNHAQRFVKRYMRNLHGYLTVEEQSIAYHSERDALHLLAKVERKFAPIKLPFAGAFRKVWSIYARIYWKRVKEERKSFLCYHHHP